MRTQPSPWGPSPGHDPRDRHTWNAPVPDYRQSLDGDIKGMRVGLITELVHSDLVDSQVRDEVLKASAVLGELGATVEEVSIPNARYASAVLGTHLFTEPALDHRDWVRTRQREYGHDTRMGMLVGSLMPAQAYYKAQKLRSLIRRDLDEAASRYDVLALPTVGRTAQPIMEDPSITSKQTTSRIPYLMTRVFPLANMPAISVPCGFGPDGLPIGLQFGGRSGADATLLKVAHAYEQATPWHTNRPPHA